MNNNKGFTLIELLAVIVILSLLFGIGFTAVSRYINETRNTTYETYEKNMEDATKNMMSDCLKKNTEDCIPANGRSKKVTLGDLETFKYSERLKDPEADGKFCDPNGSFVIVTNSSGNETDLTYQVCLMCSNYKSGFCDQVKRLPQYDCNIGKDKENPTCGITAGESTLWTNKDRVITVACSDDCMGCEKDSYSVRYSETTKTAKIKIKDNAEKETECPVNVYVDKGIPTCELQVTGTLNSETGWYGGNAPVVKWKTKTDGEGESGLSTYGLGLEKTNYNFDKEDTFTVSPGITTVYGYVKDKAGNVGICSVEVRYDSDKPVIKSVDYGYKVYPKEDISSASGSTITLNSITGEYGTIIGAYVYAKNGVGGQITFKNGSTELSKITMGSGVKKQRYKFNTSGNYNNITITLASSSQLNDIERIELLTDHTNGIYTNQNITMYINGSDSLSGKAEYSFDDGSIWSEDNSKVYSQNQASLKLKMRDRAKNVSDVSKRIIDNIDKLDPTCSVSFSGTMGSNNWYTTNATVTLTKGDQAKTTDNAKSDIRNYGLTTSTSTTYNSKTSDTQSDTKSTTWYGYVRDKAGNTKSCNSSVKVDTVNPACELKVTGTVGSNSWYTSDVKVEFKSKTDATSTIDTFNLSTSNTASYSGTSNLTQSTDTKSVTYYGYVKDKAGRTGKCTTTFKRDASVPTCSLKVTSGTLGSNSWYTSNVTIGFNTKADTISDIGSFDLTDSATASYNGGTSKTLSDDTTSKTYYGYVKNGAGLTNKCTITVKRDTVSPTCELKLTGTVGSNSWYTSDVKVEFKSKTDATSTIDTFNLSTSNTASYSGTSNLTQSTDTKSVTYYGYVKDKAGKTGNCFITFKRDANGPTLTISNPTNGRWTKDPFVLSLTGSDGYSGLDYYYYSYDNSSFTKYTASYEKTSYTTTNFSAQRNATAYIRVYDKAGNYTTQTTTIRIDKCEQKSSSCGSCGNYGACSTSCGTGTKTGTKSCTYTSTFGSGFSCGTGNESCSSSCTDNSGCAPSWAGKSCPEFSDLFGEPISCDGYGSQANTNGNYGPFDTGISSYTCYASGGPCSRTKGYKIICSTDLCGAYKGKWAYEIEQLTGCHYSNYWCQCSGSGW